MSKIIAVMNNKGGVLKTSLVTNLAGVLALKNKKVLILDTDPQGSSIGRFGRNADEEKHNLIDYLKGDSTKTQVVKWIHERKIAIVASDFSLSLLDNYIINKELDAEQISKKIKCLIKDLSKEFDYILIDSAPTFGRMTNEVLKIAEEIIVPTSLEQDSFKGVTTMINVLSSMKMKEKLKWIVPVLVKPRTNLHKTLLSQWLLPLAKQNNIYVTNTHIKDSIRVATATAIDKLPITLTKGQLQAKQVYFDLAKEIGLY